MTGKTFYPPSWRPRSCVPLVRSRLSYVIDHPASHFLKQKVFWSFINIPGAVQTAAQAMGAVRLAVQGLAVQALGAGASHAVRAVQAAVQAMGAAGMPFTVSACHCGCMSLSAPTWPDKGKLPSDNRATRRTDSTVPRTNVAMSMRLEKATVLCQSWLPTQVSARFLNGNAYRQDT
eukprot:1157863-Pelagomonas_calceolata.AAC.5